MSTTEHEPEGGARTSPGNRRSRLAGVYAPICTPFTKAEDFDPGALRDNLALYAEGGIHGYLALGSNGENRSLTEEERLQVLDVVVRHRGEAVDLAPSASSTVILIRYKVQPGERLAKVGRNFGVRRSVIAKANPDLGDPPEVSVGDVIRIPVPAGTPAEVIESVPGSLGTSTPASVDDSGVWAQQDEPTPQRPSSRKSSPRARS